MGRDENPIEITVEEFRESYPEFVNPPYTDAVVKRFINLSYCYISNLNCGCVREDCRAQVLMLMTAHLMVIWTQIQRNGGVPMVGGVSMSFGLTQKSKVGDVEVSLAMPNIASLYQSWINSTYYGQLLYNLLMAHAATPRYVGGTRNRLFWTH